MYKKGSDYRLTIPFPKYAHLSLENWYYLEWKHDKKDNWVLTK